MYTAAAPAGNGMKALLTVCPFISASLPPFGLYKIIESGAGCSTGICSVSGGSGTSSSGTQPVGTGTSSGASGGAGASDPGSAGPGNPGPANPAPGGGSASGDGDVLVDNDIWHESAGCLNCGHIWTDSANFVYWFARQQAESLVLGGVLAKVGVVASEALSRLPRINIAVGEGSPFHVAYGVGDKWLHAQGNQFFRMRIIPMKSSAVFLKGATQFSLPIRNEAAVLATRGLSSWSCVTAAMGAFIRGWIF